MKRHQHHLRQKQPPTLLLSEQKGWVNNISQHFFLKLYYTRSHCHALGWLSLNIHVMHTWATLSFAMICHSGAFAKLWKKLWFRGAFATAYRNATHTHTETSEAWSWRDAIKLDPSNCILWGYKALQSKGFLPRWKYWKEGMGTWEKTWTVSSNHHTSHQQHPPAWSATTCGSNLNRRCKTG